MAMKAITIMSEPYLILHKVRGQPAFDIAEKIMIGDEEGWIIPTSGHRAYPYWYEKIVVHDTWIHFFNGDYEGNVNIEPMPDSWPDHYEATAAPKGSGLITNLAEKLGLLPKIERRF